MKDMYLVYVTCEDAAQAVDLGRALLKKRLCACVNILPHMHSMYFWPPKKQYIEEADEAVLLLKTTKDLFGRLEREVKSLHSYDCPCVMAVAVTAINKDYHDWLLGELT